MTESPRLYKAADIQLDVILNKSGWHFPQQRILSLWGDVDAYFEGERAPEPLFFRANTGDCITYQLTNLVPNIYELAQIEEFQQRIGLGGVHVVAGNDPERAAALEQIDPMGVQEPDTTLEDECDRPISRDCTV